MKRFGKKLAALTAAAVIGLVSLTGCGSKEIDYTKAVAVVNDEEIAFGTANFYARMQQAQYESYYASFMGDNMWAMTIDGEMTYEDSFKESIMESLQSLYVIEDHMDDYDVELTPEDHAKIAKAVENPDLIEQVYYNFKNLLLAK